MEAARSFDPHLLALSWPPGEAPWELPRGERAPPPEGFELYLDLFDPAPAAPPREPEPVPPPPVRAAPEPAGFEDGAEGAWLIALPRSAGEGAASAASEPTPAPASARSARRRAAEAVESGITHKLPPKVLRVGEVDIDTHRPTLGVGGGQGSALEGADLKKILVDPPAGGSLVPTRLLLPVLLLLLLGAPLAIWPHLPGKALSTVLHWIGPDGPEGGVALGEPQGVWVGGGKYAVQADAVNEGDRALDWVQVEVRAKGSGMNAAAVQRAYCGKVLGREQIASMEPAELRAFLGKPGPESALAPGATAACQAVLTGLTAPPERFDLVVTKAEPAAAEGEPAKAAQEEGLDPVEAAEDVPEEAP